MLIYCRSIEYKVATSSVILFFVLIDNSQRPAAMSYSPFFRMAPTQRENDSKQPEDDPNQVTQQVTLLVVAEAAFCEQMSSLAKFAATATRLKTNAEIKLLQHPFHFPPHMRRLRQPGNYLPQIECNIPDFNPQAVARDIIQLPTDGFKKEAILDWCDGYVESLRYTLAKDIGDDLQQCRQQASAFLVMWLEPMADAYGRRSRSYLHRFEGCERLREMGQDQLHGEETGLLEAPSRRAKNGGLPGAAVSPPETCKNR
jgi:hypothetical protein